MVLNLSESEATDLGRMLQSRPWGFVMKYLQDQAALDRGNILNGQITTDRMLELRGSQADLQCISRFVKDIYAAGKLRPPAEFGNVLG